MIETQGLYLDLSTPLSLRPQEMFNDLLEFQTGAHECISGCRVGHADNFALQFFNAILAAYKGLVPEEKARHKEQSAVEDDREEAHPREGEGVSEVLAGPKKQAWVVQQQVGEENDMITADHLVVKAPDKAPKIRGFIPGSTIMTSQKKIEVERRIACRTEKGKWVYNETPRILPWPKKPRRSAKPPCDYEFVQEGRGIAYEAADRAVLEGSPWTVRETLKWEWKVPAECAMEKITHERFCRLLGRKRSVFVVGDSMNVGLFGALHSNIQIDADLEADPTVDLFESQPLRAWDIGARYRICNGYSICNDVLGVGQGVEFRQCFNSHLTLPTVPLVDQAPWALKLAEWSPSIVFLNTGAHVQPGDVFEREVRAALWFIRKTLPDALIIWRNTPPGHLNCTTYDGPIKRRQPAAGLPFGWANFTTQNEVAKALVKEVGGVYIDVDKPSALRPDGHFGNPGNLRRFPDCLHWCQPGPLDTWIHLIYMALKDLLQE
eukprot:TRINITY_DN4801_c2_g1_i5.p1 TRINITY_DN4801_c2_g1~~TRINITY_DN4801_c2_g1_i5.p1  ORF type:complete len:545 (-),score=61.23 TRINITY_DN4801_c2_g1_i5:710-2185(-)